MGILDEDIARARDQTDLVALVGEKVALRRVGQRYLGLCPFHQEKTPSFNVNPTLGFWHCFGCNKSGDAITFVREIDGLDFVDAVEDLAKRAGITLRYDDRAQAKDRTRRDRLVAAVAAAIDFYHRRLLESDDGGLARRYLRSRGFDGEAARRFQLGYSPDDWDLLARHLQQEKKLAREDIEGAGLAFVNKANRLQDQFRGRLMFPIYDAKGDAVGFGGRLLDGEGPKYKNSPETPIYQKSRLLYGLNWAKAEVVAKGEVIISEGYTDVMALALAGAGNAVATCGTALADDHVRALKNLARRVTLAYDSDAAGQGAAEQWYRWETEFEIEVRVADLPAGRDPADVWQDDPQALLTALDAAVPFLQFRVDRTLAAADLDTLEGKGRAAERAVAIIAEHPSDLVRDQYVMQLSGRLGIGADRLRDEVTSARNRPKRSGVAGSSAPGGDRQRGPADEDEPHDEDAPPTALERAVSPREVDLLRWALHEPNVVGDWLEEPLFLDPVARDAFRAIADHRDLAAMLDAASPPARALLERIAVQEPADEGDEHETLPARLVATASEPVAKRLLAQMLADDDDRQTALKHDLDELAHAREVGDWNDAREAGMRLVGWIVHESKVRAE
jgi:DNA primase